MKQISLQEMNWLIEKGYLKMVNGKYENLTVTGKCKGGTRKKRYVPENLYNRLKFMK